MGYIIAVDGPAGSGKGAATKKLAKKIGFTNLDTGAIYRCIALLVLSKRIKIENHKEIAALLDDLDVQFKIEDDIELVFLNGEDVSEKIRTQEVTKIVSPVSSIKEVREKMTILQRKMAEGKNIIMEGRDIGTCVFPNAEVKIYLDATVEERAKRRYKENIEKGMNVTYEEILQSVKIRDHADMTREVAPLKKAEDAVVLDSTNLTIEQVVEKMTEIIEEKIGGINK